MNEIKGRKRTIPTDAEGNLVRAVIRTARIQDRGGAPLVLAEIVDRLPWLRQVFAGSGLLPVYPAFCSVSAFALQRGALVLRGRGFAALPFAFCAIGADAAPGAMLHF